MTRAARKLILASVLLGFATFLPSPAKALGTCCQNCENQWLTGCWNNCNGDAGCQSSCERNYEFCAGHCLGEACPF